MDILFWDKFILLALVIFRLAEVISIDTISQRTRLWIGRHATKRHGAWWYVSELVNCPYCVGVWLSFVGAFLLGASDFYTFVLYAFSLAGFSAFMESIAHGD